MPFRHATLVIGLVLHGFVLAPASLRAAESDAATSDGATADAARSDGAAADAARSDGATADAARSDGAAADAATTDGATADTAAPNDVAANEAAAVVKKTLAAARGVVDAGGTRDEKVIALRAVARTMLDTRAMGRRAIGDVLAQQPPQQQEEYFELFDRVIVRAYLQKLLLFRKPRFGYRKPRRQGDVVIVATKIITANAEYYVDYEMRQNEGRWVATDVIVENVSLSENYRSQFASLLRGRSFEELLELMRSKTRSDQEEPA